MKLLRDDLIIYPAEDGSNKFFVKDPSTNELFEFGEKEYFLINALKNPYHEKVLLTKFNAKFGEKETSEYLSGLIAALDGWGLLKENHEFNTSDKKTSATIRQTEKILQLTNRKQINHWSLFCPQKLLDKLVHYFNFFRFFYKLTFLLFIVAIASLFSNLQLYKEDLKGVITMFTINLLSQIVKGYIARYYNINTSSFGLTLAAGIIPRFDIRIDIDENASREAKLRLTSSSLLVRIFLFSFGILLWIITRQFGSSVSILGAAMALFSMFSLLFAANPLLSSDGYRFITIYFNMPNIREKAIRSIRNYFFPAPSVIAKYSDDRLALKIYGSLSILFIVSVVVFIGFSIGRWLETNYRGLGVILFFVLIVYLIARFSNLSKARKNLQAGNPPTENNPLADKKPRNSSDNQKRYTSSTIMAIIRKVRWLRCFISAAIAVAFFLPYHYEAGGSAEVIPVIHQEIYSENKGIIKKVYFNGGEWIQKGSIIAEMENYRQKKDVELTQQAINKGQEEINILLTTPSEEEVELAKQQLLTAKLKLQYTKENYSRQETLYKKNFVSLETYLETKEELDLDRQEVIEKEASLLVIQNKVNEHELESAKLELAMLQKELEFYEEQLERTKLRMPNDGKIITMNLKNLENKFLDDGQLLAEIEDSSHVQIEIMIPEPDIDQIDIGDRVNFKALLSPNKIITGKVTSIYPVVDSTTYGKVLKVVSVIPNEHYILKNGMTGYAKVEGNEMFVIQAFTRALISFLLIEFWSWLP